MFSKIRKRLTYANVAMTLALVFAMSGGAYAASKYLITSTKQIKPSVLKSLKGKAGATGAAGLAGAQGAQGLKGETGAAGASVTGKEGEKGKEGPQGPPGTTGFTATLPSGESEKGDWSLVVFAKGTGLEGWLSDAVSFDIPLAVAPGAVHLIPAPTESGGVVTYPTPPSGCTGNVTNPGAAKGNLCVFAHEEYNVEIKEICPTGSATYEENPFHCFVNAGSSPEAADPYGFDILAEAKAEGLFFYAGTWAVRAQ